MEKGILFTLSYPLFNGKCYEKCKKFDISVTHSMWQVSWASPLFSIIYEWKTNFLQKKLQFALFSMHNSLNNLIFNMKNFSHIKKTLTEPFIISLLSGDKTALLTQFSYFQDHFLWFWSGLTVCTDVRIFFRKFAKMYGIRNPYIRTWRF